MSLNICEGAVLIFPSLSAAAVSVLSRCLDCEPDRFESFSFPAEVWLFSFFRRNSRRTDSERHQSVIGEFSSSFVICGSVSLFENSVAVLLLCEFLGICSAKNK